MEESLSDKIPGLEKLLETTPFSGLSASEKEAVLNHMSREEYDAFHGTIMESKSRFAHERRTSAPNPAIRSRLLERMDRKHSTGPGVAATLRKLVTFRIPVYQPAFAIAVIAVLFYVLYDRNPEPIRYPGRTDTVYIERQATDIQPRLDSSQEKVTESASASGTPGTEKHARPAAGHKSTANPSHDQYVENAYQKIQLVARVKRGHSASDDSALMKFLVAAN